MSMSDKLDRIEQRNQENLRWIQSRLGGLFCERLLRYAIESGAIRSCLNCDHFKNEMCMASSTGPAKPPAEVIVFGCNGHSGEIPF